MIGKVKAVSKYGFLVEGNDNWLNWNKFKDLPHEGIGKGSDVDYSASDKNVLQSFKLLSVGSVSAPVTERKFVDKNDPSTQDRIARGNACNAVFGSTLLAEVAKSKDFSEAVQMAKELIPSVAKYISQGEF